MHVLLGEEAKDMRNIFIPTFVDTKSDYYQNRIKHMVQFLDGMRYTGYLWDCLANREPISYANLIHHLEGRKIYAFWDLHSSDRIWIPQYWKYPIDAVLLICPGELQSVMPTLPEDCYFFDDTLSWALAVTHEESKPGKRLCYQASHPKKGQSVSLW